jgi:hypothetical protein
MFLGKTEKVVHDNFIQAAHRIAGRYPAYFDPVTQKPWRPVPLKLWASPSIHTHVHNTMKLHDDLLEDALGGSMPFVNKGTFLYGGDMKPKISRPGIIRALDIKLSDPLLMRLQGGISVEEAVAICQDREALIGLVHDKLCDRGIPVEMSKLKIGGLIQSHELDDEERSRLENEFDCARITRRAQTVIANFCGLAESTKIHAIQRDVKYYKSRAVDRPRNKGRWEGQWQTRVACWLSDGSLVCSVFEEEAVREQAELTNNATGQYYHQEGVFALIYWFPEKLPDGGPCTLTLAVDLPRGLPTGISQADMWLSAEAKAFARGDMEDDE